MFYLIGILMSIGVITAGIIYRLRTKVMLRRGTQSERWIGLVKRRKIVFVPALISVKKI